ncbi:MAG: inositol monophosphatase [Silicimonas sp.]|jgi:fructose-1,6-bisphosphatase/inositol monophosphatase family enzyme|nr:inositol monophosphatase [Silicimonas sp.]
MAVAESIEMALVELVRSVAKAEIMTRFRRLPEGAVNAKSAPDDLVTEADLHAEAAIAAGVRTLLPDALIVGEEAVESAPQLLGKLADAPLSVIVDPVDGTWNFAKGLTTFGVILAVAEKGEAVFGLLYDPVMDDWIWARKGGGTWYQQPGSDPRPLTFGDERGGDMTGFVPIFNFPPPISERLAGDIPGIRRIWSVRCSCHEYRVMADGGADFVLSNALKPWDHAAGALAVAEAGGAVGLLDGRAYRASITSGGYLVSARSEAALARLRATLAPVVAGIVQV